MSPVAQNWFKFLNPPLPPFSRRKEKNTTPELMKTEATRNKTEIKKKQKPLICWFSISDCSDDWCQILNKRVCCLLPLQHADSRHPLVRTWLHTCQGSEWTALLITVTLLGRNTRQWKMRIKRYVDNAKQKISVILPTSACWNAIQMWMRIWSIRKKGNGSLLWGM